MATSARQPSNEHLEEFASTTRTGGFLIISIQGAITHSLSVARCTQRFVRSSWLIGLRWVYHSPPAQTLFSYWTCRGSVRGIRLRQAVKESSRNGHVAAEWTPTPLDSP